MTDEIERLRVSPAALINVCVKPDGSVDLIPHSGVVTVTQPIPNSVPADGGFVVTLETGKTYSIPLASVDAEAERVSLWNKCRDLQGSVDAGKAACASLRADRDELRKALSAVKTWADQRCPCRNEEPNPCPLCGADANKAGDICLSAENTFPRDLLNQVRAALTPAKQAEGKNQ